jgi:hypothetical protein
MGTFHVGCKVENHAHGNYRLRSTSPCLNTGLNQAWMNTAVDLDGRHRIDPLWDRVDMGCCEFTLSGTLMMIK